MGVQAWLMKGFFDTIPMELDESARVDGATPSQIFWGVVIPLAAPVLAVVALISFVFTLNEFVIASALLQTTKNFTLPVGMNALVNEPVRPGLGAVHRGRTPGGCAGGDPLPLPAALDHRRPDPGGGEGMIVARLRLVPVGGTAGSPHELPSLGCPHPSRWVPRPRMSGASANSLETP